MLACCKPPESRLLHVCGLSIARIYESTTNTQPVTRCHIPSLFFLEPSQACEFCHLIPRQTGDSRRRTLRRRRLGALERRFARKHPAEDPIIKAQSEAAVETRARSLHPQISCICTPRWAKPGKDQRQPTGMTKAVMIGVVSGDVEGESASSVASRTPAPSGAGAPGGWPRTAPAPAVNAMVKVSPPRHPG